MIVARLALVLLALVLLCPADAGAQSAVGVDASRDRTTWHFDNPSSIDTTDLVPHYFEQQYTLDNLWFGGSVAYRAGVDWRSSFAVTPVTQATATDYDTFFDPDDVTWVAGTTGDARMHSFRVAQEVELGALKGFRLSGGYRLRIDLADFLEGDRTVTRNGVLISRTLVTTREYTNAHTHEIFVSALRESSSSRRWQVRVQGDLAPTAVNRLAIQLPDKYPGQTLVFRTTNLMSTGRLDLIRNARLPIVFSLRGERSWNYSDVQWVGRSAVSFGISIEMKR